MKVLICIGGPTASGKTSLSIKLAKILKSPIISFDSRQLYKELDIGVAKPDTAELAMVPHYMIGNISIHRNFNAGDYEREGNIILNKLFLDHDVIVAVGGTGMYIQALIDGLDEMPEIDPVVANNVEQKYKENGLSWLQQYVLNHDKVYASQVDMNNPMRLLRAVKVMESSGKPFSEYRKGIRKKRDYKVMRYYINPDRDILYDAINKRVEKMIDTGLIAEADGLKEYRHLKALHTVGYSELFDMLEGKVTLDEAINLIKRNSRRYGKRQITWFKNQGDWVSLDAGMDDENIEKIKKHLYDMEA
ncbi:MAG: tRNA (adenosine(37)-N6)-dimethylallyltransferase MiaA [Saprospiraceae bacterium]|nr:tRNA (adenosine(37)-N6)-dimethylallyltransferase MiaA [Saprospiraceae bacterium]MCA0333985.1 tRNA (adenosine(37)-N6)-dimethylallyltransferase MiaA [Bacteroidota bacterium]MCO5276353.1 tRNA (adenosine(37)-N6)-dimethylallyltransferase MiaA [Saprospiraceae bacterium]HQU94650.1 tRNA (adenosine(37)-N6)-dimethylallyltransferase MiaA [Saprospiraceae bacterium]